jgi:hypothetical protein
MRPSSSRALSLSEVPSNSRLLKPLPRVSGAPSLAALWEAEEAAKRKLAAQRRMLRKTALQTSRTALHSARHNDARGLRARWDDETGRDLKVKLGSIVAAGDEEAVALSKRLNMALYHLYPESHSQSCYFRLFKQLDDDNSGMLAYWEFERMIRKVLRIPPHEMSEAQVQAMWRWVDEDASGTIRSGEFLRLMRKGWAGFKEEEARLKKSREPAVMMMMRPNWNPTANIAWDQPPWADNSTTIAERRLFYLQVAENAAMDRARKMQETALKLEAEERQWTSKLSKLQPPTTAPGKGSCAMRASSSMPAL